VPKFAYMKPILLLALILGAAVAWADVDAVVAKYNVNGYLEGRMETIDVSYLGTLETGAVPQLARLAEEAPDAAVAREAQWILSNWYLSAPADFREWNYSDHEAQKYLPEEPQDIPPEIDEDKEKVSVPNDPDSLGIHAITPVKSRVCPESESFLLDWQHYVAG